MDGPSVCTPSTEKQNFIQLQINMPKWKPWLSDQSWEEWTDFLQFGVRKLEEVPSDLPEWPLHLLIDRTVSEHEEGNHIAPDTSLLARERQECRVC